MTPEEREKRYGELLDEYLDVPVEELTGRLVALLNSIAGFPEGEGWVVPDRGER